MAEVWYTDIHPEHKHGKALIEGCGACPRCGGCDDLVARSGGRYRIVPAREALAAERRLDEAAAALLEGVNLG